MTTSITLGCVSTNLLVLCVAFWFFSLAVKNLVRATRDYFDGEGGA